MILVLQSSHEAEAEEVEEEAASFEAIQTDKERLHRRDALRPLRRQSLQAMVEQAAGKCVQAGIGPAEAWALLCQPSRSCAAGSAMLAKSALILVVHTESLRF